MNVRFADPVAVKGDHLIFPLRQIDLHTHQSPDGNRRILLIMQHRPPGNDISAGEYRKYQLQPQRILLFPQGKHQRFRLPHLIICRRQPHRRQRTGAQGAALIDKICGKGAVREFQFDRRDAKIPFAAARPQKRNVIQAIYGVILRIHHLAAVGHGAPGRHGRGVLHRKNSTVVQQLHMAVFGYLQQQCGPPGSKPKDTPRLCDMLHRRTTSRKTRAS